MVDKNLPLVSVIIPVFNGEKKLPLALASLKAQTYTEWKAIIVNDGSTDKTKELLDSIQNEKFKVINLKNNQGRGYARQIALENAEGKYLAFLDADDCYHPEKLKNQVAILEKYHNVDLVSSGIGSFDLQKQLLTIRGIGDNSIINATKKHFSYSISPASTMLRIIKAKKINYNLKLNVGEDYDFIIRYLSNGSYFMSDDIMYYYEEIGAITFKKLMKYQFEILKTHFLTNLKFSLIKNIVVRISKIILYLLLTTLFGVERVVMRRGCAPSSFQKEEFRRILSLIHSV